MPEDKQPNPEDLRLQLSHTTAADGGHPADSSERIAEADADSASEERAHAKAFLPFPVVAVGASAGGLEAYLELFRQLAPNTGMAFVALPHLSPEQNSQLVQILASHTSMPVHPVENGAIPAPNEISVLPANARLTIEYGAFRLETHLPNDSIMMPIDCFFRSLAADQKNRAIGILLSGTDADGVLGLKTIKGEGGIAIVQTPESARFQMMPRSGLLGDYIDLVLPPQEIAAELARLARQLFHPSLQLLEAGELAKEDEPYFARVVGLLGSVNGIEFRSYKPGTLRRRIARRMALKRMKSLAEYALYLQESREELHNLHEDVLINVTGFFRDPSVFDALKIQILPALFANRSVDQPVRIWVTGCSTGEEAYTIAICLLEYLTEEPQEPSIQIFGTDASERSIQCARTALYPESIAAEVSPERLQRFFVRTDKGYQISKRVRDLCIFARQNICNEPPFTRLDLISCRNVLIHWQPGVQCTILTTFHYALRSWGRLLLGRSESIPANLDLFTPIDRQHRFYAKQSDKHLSMLPTLPFRPLATAETAFSSSLRSRPRTLDWQSVTDQTILSRYSPPGVVVNAQMEVLEVRGRPAPFLAIAPGIPSPHVLRMVHGDVLPTFREALRRAIDSDVLIVEDITAREGSNTYHAVLEIWPLHTGTTKPQQYLVVFVPSAKGGFGAGSYALMQGRDQAALPPGDFEQERARIQRDLTTTRLYLQSLIEERDTRNQELMGAYEEIQSANEEMQSANEELETAKEELQSTNEELHTVNEELLNRNQMLLGTSSDLNNLLNSINLPIVMLGSDLTVRHFTPPAEKLLRLRIVDIGRPIRDIRPNIVLDDIEPLLREVLDTLGTKELDVQDQAGRWHLLRLRPYRTIENKIEGIVITLLDVDEVRRTQKALEQARDFAQTVVEAMKVPVVVLDGELRVRNGNAAFRMLSGLSSPDLERRSFPELLHMLWDWPELRSALQGLLERQGSAMLYLQHEMIGPSPRSFCLTAQVVEAESEPVLLVVLEDVTTQKRAERLLEEDRERLAGQVRSTTEVLGRTQEELRALAGRLFTSQEEERSRIARELHDDISQKLVVVDMELQQMGLRLTGEQTEAQQQLEQSRKRIAALAEEVRRLSHQLHPSAIEHLGLPVALRSLTEEFGEREAMVTTFMRSSVPEELPSEVATALYRITQEALRNVAKHAGRTHVKVFLEGVDEDLRLTVRDFGEGFDLEERSARSLGLVSMEERARLVGGVFSIHSALGEGTVITVTVPISGGPKE